PTLCARAPRRPAPVRLPATGRDGSLFDRAGAILELHVREADSAGGRAAGAASQADDFEGSRS
ncbi:hypothetical protein ACFXA3_40695, partial [Streptomyces sp. NPDC059456]|uniref:hypothetical protein n=1 Tax=Streptomyces sp. NPDC059456 TaxID=3346838 RepID=UPI0036CA0B0E